MSVQTCLLKWLAVLVVSLTCHHVTLAASYSCALTAGSSNSSKSGKSLLSPLPVSGDSRRIAEELSRRPLCPAGQVAHLLPSSANFDFRPNLSSATASTTSCSPYQSGKATYYYCYNQAGQIASQTGTIHAAALMDQYQPYLAPGDYHTLAELWVGTLANAANYNAVEVGWTVDPGLNGDLAPHLFVYYWVNGIGKGYNTTDFQLCSGATRAPGDPVPIGSTPGRFDTVFLEQGGTLCAEGTEGWYVYYNGVPMGYYPAELWQGKFIQILETLWYGEVAANNLAPATAMGSGVLGTQAGSASIQMYLGDNAGNLLPAQASITQPYNSSWYAIALPNGVSPFSQFNYGGPGAPAAPAIMAGCQDNGPCRAWATDGTKGGSYPLTGSDVGYGVQSVAAFSSPGYGPKAAFNGAGGLWVTDGTASGTKQLKFPGTLATGTNLTAFGNKIVFTGNYANSTAQAWITDGTIVGTRPLTNLSGGVYPGNFTVSGNLVYFIGQGNDSQPHLWVTDGTEGHTFQIDVLSPIDITPFKNGVLFSAADSNGTNHPYFATGTKAVNLSERAAFALGFSVVGQKAVFFLAGSEYPLWSTDGTPDGTSQVGIEIGRKGGTVSPVYGFISSFGKAAIYDGVDLQGRSSAVWVTDGTISGTYPLTSVAKGGAEICGDAPTFPFGASILFIGCDKNQKRQLWVTDGSPGGPTRLTNTAEGFNSAGTSANLGRGLVLDGVGKAGAQIWFTDGTLGGTYPITTRPEYACHIDPPRISRGALFYCSGNELPLWFTDGTKQGTTLINSDLLASSITPLSQ